MYGNIMLSSTTPDTKFNIQYGDFQFLSFVVCELSHSVHHTKSYHNNAIKYSVQMHECSKIKHIRL
jgi:hypothetical protein